MSLHYSRRNAIAVLFALGPSMAIAAADTDSTGGPMNVVVVSGSPTEHASFDLPAAVDVVDAEHIRDAQLRVNASEGLAAVPGLVVQNRQNYAQDLQISSRGFGARSAFGVRGVRLIADGIPATMPDGQGQAATFNLDMAERIEVLRGPFSALYGNHSGGVVQLFTRDPKGPASVDFSVDGGSDGTHKTDLNAQGRTGAIGYVLDASCFETDGYRSHSAASRNQAYAKLSTATSPDSHFTLVANTLHQHDTQDPLGATWESFQADPRAGEIDPSDPQAPQRTFAERYNTRKSIDHQQLGATYEQSFGDERLHATVYGGNRHVIQYQSFSKGFQSSPSHSGGVIDFGRDFDGADINWLDVRSLAGGRLRTTVGVEYASSVDARRGYENFVGTQFGVKGNLRRDEEDQLSSLDPYLQSEWQRGQWILTAGVRHTRLAVNVRDRYLSNGDDSGGVTYSKSTPVAGLLYKLAPTLNVYASAAQGFETPTLGELFYSGSGGGFNFGLRPSTSVHLEVGAKAKLGDGARLDAALFQARTRDELVVDNSSGGRTSYRNAARTLRQGLELSLNADLSAGWSARAAATILRAVYREGFRDVPGGSRLPGVPNARLYGELAWKDASGRIDAALESVVNSKVHPDDANLAIPAPGYTVLNTRIQATQPINQWHLIEFARVNNLLDRRYVGSVIVGESNKRFYEAAPGRNWTLGLSAQYQFH